MLIHTLPSLFSLCSIFSSYSYQQIYFHIQLYLIVYFPFQSLRILCKQTGCFSMPLNFYFRLQNESMQCKFQVGVIVLSPALIFLFTYKSSRILYWFLFDFITAQYRYSIMLHIFLISPHTTQFVFFP